ncbi:unnamed protein product [Mycena citricolor]|uniref:O-methyltransferase n=1 Tax=Mycena citricolor TaxID=2018698 RepID=A0AAD2HZF5_9AGAR|nr:unnamed protein product [Mycena citricolor]
MSIQAQDFQATSLADWARSDQYHNSFLLPADTVLDNALKNSAAHGLPDIAVSAAQGKFLSLLVRSIGAKKILEVGTLGGYSTIWLCRALPDDGKLVTLELSPKHAAVAVENLTAAGQSSKAEVVVHYIPYPRNVVVGPALESMIAMKPAPGELFDFIFIDADKPGNKAYFTEAKRLVRKGGVIIVDNVVRYGRVGNPDYSDPMVEGVRALLEAVKGDPEVDATTIGTVGDKGYDGFMYMVRQ